MIYSYSIMKALISIFRLAKTLTRDCIPADKYFPVLNISNIMILPEAKAQPTWIVKFLLFWLKVQFPFPCHQVCGHPQRSWAIWEVRESNRNWFQSALELATFLIAFKTLPRCSTDGCNQMKAGIGRLLPLPLLTIIIAVIVVRNSWLFWWHVYLQWVDNSPRNIFNSFSCYVLCVIGYWGKILISLPSLWLVQCQDINWMLHKR